MNNNIIPACIIGAGLFAVALKPTPQPAPIPRAEPVAVATTNVTGPSDPVIVWYGTSAYPASQHVCGGGGGNSYYPEGNVWIFRAWSDGTIEGKRSRVSGCASSQWNDWELISTQQMACRTDINGDGEVELGDLLAVLGQWGDQATCPDTVQLQCGLGLPNG